MVTSHSQNQVGSSGCREVLTVDFEALFGNFTPQPGGDGYLTHEICEATGLSTGIVRNRLKQALKDGTCVRGTRRVERIDGRITPVTSYIFKN